MTNAGEDVEKGSRGALLVGLQIGAATMDNGMQVPQKIKSTTAIWPSNPTSGYLSKGNEVNIAKRYLRLSGHCGRYSQYGNSLSVSEQIKKM